MDPAIDDRDAYAGAVEAILEGDVGVDSRLGELQRAEDRDPGTDSTSGSSARLVS